MEITEKQIALMALENPEIDFELEGMEVFAIYSLGQMNGKVVKMQDDMFPDPRIGLFTINHLNGVENLDFSNMDDWKEVHLESISYTLTKEDKWGQSSSTYESLFHIKSIALLKQ